MKKNLVFLLIFVVGLFSISDIYAQKAKGKDIKIEPRVKELLDSKDYTLKAKTAFPQGGRSVSLDSRYELRVKGDSVYSYLPYFGRAYSIPYGGGEGLIFNGVITDYKSTPAKKLSTEIRFSVKTREDVYSFLIIIFPNGASTIKVTSNNRQGIDFNADMVK